MLLRIPHAQCAIITTLAVFTVCKWKNGREPKTKTKNKNGIILMAKLRYYTNNGNVYNYNRQIAIISLVETKICIFFYYLLF